VRDLPRRFAATPYAAPIAGELRAHGGDLQAIELGLDRWMSGQLFASVAALGRSEIRARALLLAVVRERDLELLARGAAYGLSRETAVALTTVVRREMPAAARARVSDWPARLEETRRERRRACRRAFVGEPFDLAPPLALLVGRLDEVEIILRLTEARTREAVGDLTGELAGG
jgi:hypothetical protein